MLHPARVVKNGMTLQNPSYEAETIKLIGDLIRGLQHELGNLATVLSLDVSLLEETSQAPIEGTYLDELHHNIGDLGRLLKRLKEFPGPDIHPAPVDLQQVIIESCSHLAQQAANRRMMIVYHMPETPIIINADEVSLSRMLVNIVNNALEANRQSDRRLVQVSLDSDAENARIRVADEGGGFRSDALSEPFSPAYTTKITDGFMHGLGLGLFIAHAVATLHGGTIHLANQEMGGALVTITLPLANQIYLTHRPAPSGDS